MLYLTAFFTSGVKNAGDVSLIPGSGRSYGEEVSLLWHVLAVCGFVQVACQGFLIGEACVSVLVGGAGFLLSAVQ